MILTNGINTEIDAVSVDIIFSDLFDRFKGNNKFSGQLNLIGMWSIVMPPYSVA